MTVWLQILSQLSVAHGYHGIVTLNAVTNSDGDLLTLLQMDTFATFGKSIWNLDPVSNIEYVNTIIPIGIYKQRAIRSRNSVKQTCKLISIKVMICSTNFMFPF